MQFLHGIALRNTHSVQHLSVGMSSSVGMIRKRFRFALIQCFNLDARESARFRLAIAALMLLLLPTWAADFLLFRCQHAA